MSNDKDSAPPKPAANRPWVEKYRPKDLTQVSHQAEVVATLQNAVETGRLPHLLFYGPPGSGKTSVALALCRQLWHPRDWKRRVLELNASDERGISVVRDKIKHFASLAVGQATTKKKTNFFGQPQQDKDDAAAADTEQDQKKYPNPPFKVIILDEADTVTPDAQAALRRIIESHSRITRFILICNYVTRIIEPLASRCAKFRFQSLPPESMKARLTEIAHAEGCNDTVTAVVDDILQYAGGDMRRAVTTLQSVHSTGLAGSGDTVDAIAELAGLPPAGVVNELWASMNQPKFAIMQAAVDDACAAGFSAQLLVAALLDKILAPDSGLNELSLAEIAIRIAEAEKNMTEGADEYLQFMTVATLVLTCFQKSERELNQPTAMVTN